MSTTNPTPAPAMAAPASPDPATDSEHDGDRGTSRAWMTVAAREMSVKLRDKGFIASTVVILLIMIASAAFSVFMAQRTTDVTVATYGAAEAQVAQALEQIGAEESVDAESADADADAVGQLGGAGVAGAAMGNDRFQGMQVPDATALEAALEDGSADIGLVKTAQGWEIVADKEVSSSVKAAVAAVISQLTMETNAQAAGTSMAELAAGSQTTERLLNPHNEGIPAEGMRYLSAMVFGFLFYFAAMLFGYSVAGSVVEEKQSRIVEILAAALPIRQLLFGKVIGLTVLATAQVALFAVIGLIAVSFTDLSAVLPMLTTAAAWYVLFFVLGFIALAALFAAAGALAARSEDIQQTASPVLMLVMLAFFGGLMASGTVQTVMSYIPIVSAIVMPVRIATGSALWWEPIVALALTVVTVVALIWIADRIYRRSLMQTSRKMTYREALFGRA